MYNFWYIFVISLISYYCGIFVERYLTKRHGNVLALKAEKKAIKVESERLRAMYEAVKGDLEDSLRSHGELADEFLEVCEELKEAKNDI